jgi:hypothetical protein
MQATITYLLTEQAQRAQMAATGQPVARKQVLTVEVAPEDIDLFLIDEAGNLSLDASKWGYQDSLAAAGWKANGSETLAATPNPDVIGDLKRGRAIREAEKLEKERITRENSEHNRRVTEEAYKRFLSDPQARGDNYGGPKVEGLLSPADWWPSQHEEFTAEIRRRSEADALAKKAAEEQKELAKQAFINEWIENNTDEETHQQHADGLLARKDALELIANSTLDPIAPKYVPRVCEDRDCACGRKDIDTLPRAIYPALKTLKAKLPPNSIIEMERVRECLRDADGFAEDKEATAPRYAATIKVPVGPFVFERLVRLRQDA